MTHDPLCLMTEPCGELDSRHTSDGGCHSCGTDTCQCDLIAKVRADERVKAGQRVYGLPRGANISLADAVAAGDADAGVGWSHALTRMVTSRPPAATARPTANAT